MKNLLKELEDYCTHLGADPSILPDDDAQALLPLYLRQLYQPAKATLFGRPRRLLLSKQAENPTPGEVEAHARVLTKHLGPGVMFVFGALAAFDRNRLLRKRVPFIVPHRQMFIPDGAVDLRETHSPAASPTAAVLSMPAQLLLLHHLQKPTDEVLTLSDWAKRIRYSKMTVTRAHRELVSAGLATSTSGKSVVLRFASERRALWEQALPLLHSPIQGEGSYLIPAVQPALLLSAGLTALAHYTDLAEGEQRVLATGRLLLQNQPDIVPVSYKDETTVAIQRWWYNPALLAGNGEVVDRLSLFLSLRNHGDERVQLALKNLLKGMTW